jgi:hypothetical protein
MTRPTIYKKLLKLRKTGKIRRVELGRYSSNNLEFAKRITQNLLSRDYHEEAIGTRESMRGLIFYDDLALLSIPYEKIQAEIDSLEKSKLKSIIHLQKLVKLYGLKARLEEQVKDEFLPLMRLVSDATTINILSESQFCPYPRSQHDLDTSAREKAVDLYLDELRDAVWKMLLLYTAHPNFSLGNSGLTVIINFEPKNVLKKADQLNDFKEYLEKLDHSGSLMHFVKEMDEILHPFDHKEQDSHK